MLDERFHKKYIEDEQTGCWVWQGKISSQGGRFCTGDKSFLAHRYAFEHLVKPIPDGVYVRQVCENRACVNPSHLTLVLPTELVVKRTPCYWQRVLTDEAVREIRYSSEPGRVLAQKWKTSVQSVSNIRNWKTYKAVR